LECARRTYASSDETVNWTIVAWICRRNSDLNIRAPAYVADVSALLGTLRAGVAEPGDDRFRSLLEVVRVRRGPHRTSKRSVGGEHEQRR
jgi:hypothetical protein